MANGKVDNHENDVIDHFLRSSSKAATSGYLALYSVAPTESAPGTELTGNGYARIAIGFDAPSNGATTNAGIVKFTAAGGSWLQIVGHSICNAASAGAITYFQDNIAGPTLDDTDSYEFAIGAITASET